jgi:serine/threonine protein kinase
VVDFGLAKVRDVAASTALTHTGAVIGTLYYMSPEQCSGEELDARADVYSLGAMLYEMLTGGPPFRSSNLAGLIAKHLNAPPPPFPEGLQIPALLESVCLRALAKDRNQRQPDALAFGRELQNALNAPVVYQPSFSSRRSPLKWILLATGLFLALIFVVGAGIAIKFGMDQFRSTTPSDITNRRINHNVAPPVASPQVASTSVEDLRGTWAGTYGPLGYATKLIIKNHNGNSLDGVLEQGTFRIAFKGTYDARSRTLTMLQTEVLSGEGWDLGEDIGKLSPDGRRISGTGKDAVGSALGMTYQWSFMRNLKE